MVGGFRLSGTPGNTIGYARTADHIKDIIVISMEFGDEFWAPGRLIEKTEITK